MEKTLNHISPSSVMSFLGNYKEWYDNYLLGIKPEDNIYFSAGSWFHWYVEHFFDNTPQETDTLDSYTKRMYKDTLEKSFETEEWKRVLMFIDNEDCPYNKQEILDWIKTWTSNWYKSTKKLYNKYGLKGIGYNTPIYRELEISPDNPLHLKGFVDAIYYQDRFEPMSNTIQFEVVDYKTSTITYQSTQVHYYLQLLIYATYLRKYRDMDINWVSLEYVKTNRRDRILVTQNICDSIEQLIKDVYDEMVFIFKEFNKGKDMSRWKTAIKIEKYLG